MVERLCFIFETTFLIVLISLQILYFFYQDSSGISTAYPLSCSVFTEDKLRPRLITTTQSLSSFLLLDFKALTCNVFGLGRADGVLCSVLLSRVPAVLPDVWLTLIVLVQRYQSLVKWLHQMGHLSDIRE